MGMLDHWQPVARSQDLRQSPVEAVIAGHSLAVFRTASGEPAVVSNVCPHRRLKLTAGEVVGDRIRCKYHGWTFDACGHGESPATPKLTACITSYDTREEHGLIWVKSRSSHPEFPSIEVEGFYPLGAFTYLIPAPLELAVDNFNEIEHSGTVHNTFGYDLEHLHEVKVRTEASDDEVRITNVGPSKRIFWLYAWWLGIRRGDLFHDHWTTRFSPVHSVFDHWWTSPDGKRESMLRWRVYIFFVPQDEKNTRIFVLGYAKSRYPGPNGCLRPIAWLFRKELDKEVRADVSMLNHMADLDPTIEGLKLSRFDKVLGLNRERINRIYRGLPVERLALA
jgi:phenylpropionate dioxygenase-like ring-hydroxylating dioxygenase large terminal subunit